MSSAPPKKPATVENDAARREKMRRIASELIRKHRKLLISLRDK